MSIASGHRNSTLVAAALVAVAAAGCTGSDGATMSAQEKAAFSGNPTGGVKPPRTDAQNAEIADFKKNFERMHPSSANNGQGKPPASSGG